MNFGEAIEAMKSGKLVSRKGWNGKGMFICIVPGSEFNANRSPWMEIFAKGSPMKYQAHIDMST